MIHIDNGPVKHNQDAQTPKEPGRHALIAEVTPGSPPFITKMQLLHVLIDHCGVTNEAEAVALTNRAILNGKAVIRLGSRDLIETLLHECHCCPDAQNSNEMRFISEQA